jgi:hypothetical protein
VPGTTVWGGPIDNGCKVIVLSGEPAGMELLTLKRGQVTMLFGDGNPQRAVGQQTG